MLAEQAYPSGGQNLRIVVSWLNRIPGATDTTMRKL